MQHLMTMVPASESAGGAGALLPHYPELIFGLVVFLLLWLFVRRSVFPAMEKTYAARAAAIEGGMKQAEEAQAKAEAALHEYEDQLAQARAEAAKIRDEAREQGARIHAELRSQAQAEAERITAAAHKQIEAERQAAVIALRAEVGRLSTDLASRIVGESLHDETRQKGIIDRFIADLESADPASITAAQGSDA